MIIYTTIYHIIYDENYHYQRIGIDIEWLVFTLTEGTQGEMLTKQIVC